MCGHFVCLIRSTQIFFFFLPSSGAAGMIRKNTEADGRVLFSPQPSHNMTHFSLSLPFLRLHLPLTLFPNLQMIIACRICFIQLVISFGDIILFTSANSMFMPVYYFHSINTGMYAQQVTGVNTVGVNRDILNLCVFSYQCIFYRVNNAEL